MDAELIDEWDIESKQIPGLVFHVRVENMPEDSPFDEYHQDTVFAEPDAVAAWERGEWQIVYTEVTPEYKGILLEGAANGIGGTEWGQFPGAESKSDREYYTNCHPIPDYIMPEVMKNLRNLSQRDLLKANVRAAKRAARQRVKSARREARLLTELCKSL